MSEGINLPTGVTVEQIKAALTALGLPPLDEFRRLTINYSEVGPKGLTVEYKHGPIFGRINLSLPLRKTDETWVL